VLTSAVNFDVVFGRDIEDFIYSIVSFCYSPSSSWETLLNNLCNTTRTFFTMDLSQLQRQIKEDPTAYKEEFFLQYRHFLAQLQIFKLKPQHDNKEFIRLIKFLSNVERISSLYSLLCALQNRSK
jgi:hypothetical protein